MSPSTKGASSELIVSVDLLSKSYEVFRSVSPAASCDLIALKNGQTFRVEVKTGTAQGTRHRVYPKPPTDNFDILAIVFPGAYSSISYTPSL
jgi:hypothetical protein